MYLKASSSPSIGDAFAHAEAEIAASLQRKVGACGVPGGNGKAAKILVCWLLAATSNYCPRGWFPLDTDCPEFCGHARRKT